jgi:Protein of unknown function (DUF3619)
MTPGGAEALEARFGLRVTARLSTGAGALPHDVSERLRVARRQALAIAAERRMAQAKSPARAAGIVSTSGGTAALSWGSGKSSSPWWNALASALPVLVLIVGLYGIGHWQQLEQIAAAADIDVALLGDDLPPSAFTDPGFAEFLLEPLVETPAQ